MKQRPPLLADSEQTERYKSLRRVSLDELVVKVSNYFDADKDEVLSGNRKQKNCQARDLISFLAAKSMGYKFNDIAEIFGIYPVKCMAYVIPGCFCNMMIRGQGIFHCTVLYLTGVHPVTAGRCAEKGKKMIDNYEGIWDILEKRS